MTSRSLTSHPPRSQLLRAFENRVARDSSAPVVVSASRRLTASELDARSVQLAANWPAIEPGALVGLRAPAGPEFLAAWLALLRREATAVLLDPGCPTATCLEILARIGAWSWVRVSTPWASAASDPIWEPIAREPEVHLVANPGWAAVKLSSGSTGRPRGIAVSAEALLADEENLWRAMELEGLERFLATLPLSHSYGLSSLALPALVRRVTLVAADAAGPFEPVRAARTFGAQVFPTVPPWLSAWSQLSEPPMLPDSLARLICAGAPLAPEAARRVRSRLGRPVQVFYGSSETGGIAFDQEGGAAERGTVGTAIAGVEVTLDPDNGRLRVRSAAVADRYLPEPDPALTDGSFLTGDLGRFDDDGELRLTGRADDLLFVKGKSLHPREVEEVLLALPGVEEAAVFRVALAGGEESTLRAAVAGLKLERTLGVDEVLAHCRRHLAPHKVPRGVVFLERLPRTERGKVDRRALEASAD